MNALKQLLKPLAYIRIRHPTKAYFDWWLPLAFAVLAWLFLRYVVRTPALFGSDGLISGVNELLQVLVGFYIAALAAIATFQKPGMDDRMAGDPVTLEEEYRGSTSLIELTRRRFLCYLFGYLAWLSLALYFASIIISASRHSLVSALPPQYVVEVKFALLFVYLFVLANLFITTMLGLYYMSHRLHLGDPTDLGAKKSP